MYSFDMKVGFSHSDVNHRMTIPAIIAVIRPEAASAPELTPKASASGRATAATVSPDIRSADNFFK